MLLVAFFNFWLLSTDQSVMPLTCADRSPDNNKRPTETNHKATSMDLLEDRYRIMVNLPSCLWMSTVKLWLHCLNLVLKISPPVISHWLCYLSNRVDKGIHEVDWETMEKTVNKLCITRWNLYNYNGGFLSNGILLQFYLYYKKSHEPNQDDQQNKNLMFGYLVWF